MKNYFKKISAKVVSFCSGGLRPPKNKKPNPALTERRYRTFAVIAFRPLLVATTILTALAILPLLHAQQSSSRSSGGGNSSFGGGSRSSGSSSSSSGTSGSRDYPNSTLPGDYTVSIDPETHSLVILTDDSTFTNLSKVISTLDKPKPQVLIKVVFVEVQHDDDLDFGVDGSYNHSNPNGINGSPVTSAAASNIFGLAGLGSTGQTIGQSTMPTGAGIYSVMGNDFQATVRAIASASKVEVLSRPSIMVRNNQPATITVGQSVPLVTGVTYPTITGGPVSTVSYTSVGIILQVTPFISNDGLVEMIVSPQISSLSSQTVQVATNVNIPVIDLRSASTVVVAPDGQTVIIGGLIENDKTFIDSKIPLLGDIPLLGNLFKHRQQAITKKELLIFLTPHIVNMPGQMASVADSEGERATISRKDFKEKEMYKFFDTLPVRPNTLWNSPNKYTNNVVPIPDGPDDVNK